MPRTLLVSASVLMVIGLAVMIVGYDDTAAVITGSALVGLAGIVLVSLLFYAIGRSEDRERAADQARRR